MNSKTISVKLSSNFYLLSILTGILLGILIAYPIANMMIKGKAKSAANSISYYDSTGHVNQEAQKQHEEKYAAALSEGKSSTLPIMLVAGALLFSILFVIVGRHRQPVSIDDNGIDVYNWFGKRRHLWTNFQDKTIIKVKSTGVKVAAFEQFHFSTGTVSVKTNRLNNGDVVLNYINDKIAAR